MKENIEVTKKINLKEKDNRWAEIFFTNGKFSQCIYHTNNAKYNLEDWRFLLGVAKRIIKEATLKKYSPKSEKKGS